MIIIQIAGRLGKDAETRFTASGQKVTSLSVATNVRKAGKDETIWWRVTLWGERWDKLLPHLKKGSGVIVVGEMSRVDQWSDKEGRQQVTLEMTAEIIRFNPFGGGGSERQQQEGAGTSQYGMTQTYGSGNQQHASQNNEQADDYGMNYGTARAKANADVEEPLPF